MDDDVGGSIGSGDKKFKYIRRGVDDDRFLFNIIDDVYLVVNCFF